MASSASEAIALVFSLAWSCTYFGFLLPIKNSTRSIGNPCHSSIRTIVCVWVLPVLRSSVPLRLGPKTRWKIFWTAKYSDRSTRPLFVRHTANATKFCSRMWIASCVLTLKIYASNNVKTGLKYHTIHSLEIRTFFTVLTRIRAIRFRWSMLYFVRSIDWWILLTNKPVAKVKFICSEPQSHYKVTTLTSRSYPNPHTLFFLLLLFTIKQNVMSVSAYHHLGSSLHLQRSSGSSSSQHGRPCRLCYVWYQLELASVWVQWQRL